MSDPRLLRDGTSRGFDRALLESAQDDRAPVGSEDRALAALGIGAVAVAGAVTVAAKGLSSPPAAMAASKIATAVLLKWLGITLAVTIAVSVPITYVVMSRSAQPEAAPHAADAPAPVATTAPPPLAEAPAPEVTPAASVAAPVATSSSASAAVAPAVAEPRNGTPVPARSVSSLSPELDVLDRARHALAAHDAVGARAALDEYQRRFPRGALREEAELASIETLLLSGDAPGTREAANKFLASHPDSAYAARVRAIAKRASNP